MKKTKKKIEVKKEILSEPLLTAKVIDLRIQPITENFSNGDMNVLRDKINEIIKYNQ